MPENMDELVRLITERVVATLSNASNITDARNEGKKKCLVLGDMDNIPEALVQDMILLDEPTAGLDPMSRADILEKFLPHTGHEPTVVTL